VRKRILIALAVISVFIAVLYFASRHRLVTPTPTSPEPTITPSMWREKFLTLPSSVSANENLYDFTRFPTVAGTEGGAQAITLMQDKLKSYGLTNIKTEYYKVFLSYPISHSLSLVSPSSAVFTAALHEPNIPFSDDPTQGTVPTFNAYSASGNITGEIVYVNYGRIEDYELLAANGVDLTGKIALARYGRNFRGLKAMIGEKFNISALLIYSDPIDDGARRDTVYPAGIFRPSNGVQRGSAAYISMYSGDPLTPNSAAVPNLDARKYTPEDAPTLPQIPILPISSGDAKGFLQHLGGFSARTTPEFHDWQGGFDDEFDYHIGGVGEADPGAVIANLNVEMNNTFAEIGNVIATIPGRIEDEIVLLGNHRDAWVFGAADPHSGTSAFLEIARSFASMYQDGWRPMRTIQLCSWDAEEYGLIGSVEWTEQYAALLQERAVAYLNVDVGAMGFDYQTQASPSLADLMQSITKYVDQPGLQPDAPQTTIYDAWNARDSATVHPLGSGSDYTSFLQHLGIPAADMRFSSHPSLNAQYHSIYDCYHWMNEFIDPGAKAQTALSQVWGLAALHLSDDTLLPFNLTTYAVTLRSQLDAFMSAHADIISTSNDTDSFEASIVLIRSAITSFEEAASVLHVEARTLASQLAPGALPSQALQELNNKIRKAERYFLSENGLPGRPDQWYKHVVYAPSLYGGYDASVFPGLADALRVLDWDTATSQGHVIATAITAASQFIMIPQS
jgi:N-acetylated-alpha-linked acidic dipeptidase